MPAIALAAYDKPYVGEQKIYIADEDDTLVHIARDHMLGFVEMRAANPFVDPWLPGNGTELILPARHILPDAPREGIVINLPEMRLYAFVNGDEEPATFPLGIGREGLETPTGITTVVRKKEGPTWRPTARMRREDPKLPESVPPGPENPLGTHALYLGWPTYALHGTNKPYGIGRRISSGCIRLYPENITQLFEMVPTGTKVTVVDQPVKLAWIEDVLYMEAHPDLEQAIQMEETGQVYSAKLRNEDMDLIIKAAGEHKDRLHWATIRNEIRNRTGMPVMIARKPDAAMPEFKYEVIRGSDMPERPYLADQPKSADASEALNTIYDEEEADSEIQMPPKRTRTLNP
ncbi:MAG: L,D-transpeptidase family protein [Alphaproteobacteria bacterium]